MSPPFSILDIGRRINSLSVAYCELDDDDSAAETAENRDRKCKQTRMNV